MEGKKILGTGLREEECRESSAVRREPHAVPDLVLGGEARIWLVINVHEDGLRRVTPI